MYLLCMYIYFCVDVYVGMHVCIFVYSCVNNYTFDIMVVNKL